MSKSKIKLGLAFMTLDAKIAFVQQVIESINESASLAGVDAPLLTDNPQRRFCVGDFF